MFPLRPSCFFNVHVRQRREHRVFHALLRTVPGLEERLLEGSDDGAVTAAEMVSFLLCAYDLTS